MILSVCLVPVKKPIEERIYRLFSPLIPLEKMERIHRQRIKQNADNMLVGTVLAKYMIYKVFQIPFADQHLSYGEYEKPYLINIPDVHFNISHSGQYVACAVAEQPVGVDIQEIISYRPELAVRVCSKKEISLIESSYDPSCTFTKIWTQKEAYIKMTGRGISDSIKGISVMDIPMQSCQWDNIIVTVCCL